MGLKVRRGLTRLARLLPSATAALCVGEIVSGCGADTNPDFNTVGHVFYTAYCKRLHDCMGDAFKASFPAGEADCVDMNYKEISQLNSLKSVCSADQWQQCATDLATAPCTTTTYVGPVIPASCKGC
jgi:hypothetical protein